MLKRRKKSHKGEKKGRRKKIIKVRIGGSKINTQAEEKREE